MQIRNIYIGTPPLQCLVITNEGNKTAMSSLSTPLIDIPDNASEVIVRWQSHDFDVTKVWTAAHGWLEVADYEERKKFAEEKRQLEEDKKRFKARKGLQLDVKVTQPDENDTPPELE